MDPIRLYQDDDVSQSTSLVENCSICLDNLNSSPTHELSECNHKFHSSCLIPWLRVNNGCPMCRGVASNKNSHYYRSEGTILRHILNFCRSKKNTSKKLKKMYSKYIKSRDIYNYKRKQKNDFTKLNKNIFKQSRKLSVELWRSRRSFFQIKREIASLPIQFINKK
jgi:hypothetical protein